MRTLPSPHQRRAADGEITPPLLGNAVRLVGRWRAGGFCGGLGGGGSAEVCPAAAPAFRTLPSFAVHIIAREAAFGVEPTNTRAKSAPVHVQASVGAVPRAVVGCTRLVGQRRRICSPAWRLRRPGGHVTAPGAALDEPLALVGEPVPFALVRKPCRHLVRAQACAEGGSDSVSGQDAARVARQAMSENAGSSTARTCCRRQSPLAESIRVREGIIHQKPRPQQLHCLQGQAGTP